jgi:orotate phosphoribosyltransferase
LSAGDRQAEVLSLLSAQRGHFRHESGFHGDLWLDLDRLILRPARLAPLSRELAARLRPTGVEAIVGPLTGGAFIALTIAAELDLLFCASEPRAGDAGEALYSVSYRIPPSLAPLLAGKRVAVVDDVINAGSALRGTFAALVEAGARPVVAAALLVLGERIEPFLAENHLDLIALARLPSPLWEPKHCPLCARAVPFGPSHPVTLRGFARRMASCCPL